MDDRRTQVQFAGGREVRGDRTDFFDRYSFQFFKSCNNQSVDAVNMMDKHSVFR